MRGKLIGLLAAAAIAGQARAEEGPLPKEFETIETIVVVFLENRSFVNLLPSFPGALGVAQSPPESLLQRDRDGSVLPHLPPVWKSSSTTPDPAYPASMRNAPFAIDEPPYDLPASVLTVNAMLYRPADSSPASRNTTRRSNLAVREIKVPDAARRRPLGSSDLTRPRS